MRPTLYDDYGVIFDLIDYSIYFVDSSAPITLPLVLKNLGPADAGEWVTVNGLQDAVYAIQGLPVLSLPVQVVFPCFISP